MLRPGEILDNTYQIVQKIGSGGTGDVYLAYHIRLEKYVVVKKIKDKFVNIVNVRAEVDILKRLKHTYLPQVYDFVQYGTQVYTVMDYIEGISLEDYINNGIIIDEELLLKWLIQLCEVLVYLHSQTPSIIHSDIKPANIMITTDYNICLIDFNISLDAEDESQISGISLPYASPEQYVKAMLFTQKQEHRHIVLDGRTDMYSLGATFYQLLTMSLVNYTYENIPPLTSWQLPYSEALLEILDISMAQDVNYRYSNMEEMLKAVKSVYKRTKEYKKYLLGVISSSIVYLVVVCVGIYFIVKGTNLQKYERYEQANKEFTNYYENEDYKNAIDEGYEIINNREFDKILDKNKGDKIQIFHIIGESCFEIEDYVNALENYEMAISYVDNIEEYSDYYRDYIVALVRCGKEDEALEKFEILKQADVEDENIKVVQAELLVRNKQYEEAIESIEGLTNENIDDKTKRHLLVLGSDAAAECGKYEKQIEFLLEAQELDNNTSILRKLGNAYMDIAFITGANGRTAEKYYKDAVECYEELYEKSYNSINDGINLAICYRALKEYDDSIDVLKEMEKEYTDYRIYMNLAFAYDKFGDTDNCKRYVRKCFAQYDETPESDKESESSDNMQSLKELERKYD